MRIVFALLFTALVSAPAHGKVLASCGPLIGHSHFFKGGFNERAEWTSGKIDSTTIFVQIKDKLDVIIKGKDLKGKSWTRSASDYGAPVYQVNLVGGKRHILVLWRLSTELYLLDIEGKTLSLVSHKSGLVPGTHAHVGTCE